MNFSFDKFLKPIIPGETSIRIYDNNETIRYVINPFLVKNVSVRNNIVYVAMESSKITLDFVTKNDANLAAGKLQTYIGQITSTNVPQWIQQAVEVEAQYYTKGPTGSTGPVGATGSKGDTGAQGPGVYDVWLQNNTGTQQDFLDSLRGPVGPTGPMAFGNTDELLVSGQTINATVDGKDIEIVTQGSGNLLFKIDRDGWLVNYGKNNNGINPVDNEIWSTGVTVDDDGYIYMTGGDNGYLIGGSSTWVTKLQPNGNVIWQKNINSYSSGEAIEYKNGYLYVMSSILPQPDAFGDISIAKLDKSGYLQDYWYFDYGLSMDPSTGDYNVPNGFDIAVDEYDNVYFVGTIKNFTNDYDIIFGKLNTTTSDIEWQKLVDGGIGQSDVGYSISYRNGYVYISGALTNNGNSPDNRVDIYLAKYDSYGAKIWAKIIGNSYTQQQGFSISVDDDSIYLCGGIGFDPNPSPFNNYYMRLDLNGNVVWSKSINSFDKALQMIHENGDGSVFMVSTQGTTSNPARTTTDIIIFKISKLTGDIEWQQYVGTDSRDSVWAKINQGGQSVVSANGHRSIASSPDKKSLYVAGITQEGDTLYHNAFLMSIDQKSLPESVYGNWKIENATFSSVDFSFDYNTETTNIPSISESISLIDGFTQSVIVVNGLSYSNIVKDDTRTIFSPNTQLYVKGIINIDQNYILPRTSGNLGQVLTYVNDNTETKSDVLEWRNQSLMTSFNDFSTINSFLIGSGGMDGILTATISSVGNPPSYESINGQYDDAFVEVQLPFEVSFMGTTYSTVYVSSNSYVTFGSGYTLGTDFTEKNPPVPGIFIEAGDRSLQKLYTRHISDQFTIRYEGSVLPQGPTYSAIEMEWEITFNRNSGQMDIQIGENLAQLYAPGKSYIKNTFQINKVLETNPNTGFRIYKGWGINNVNINKIHYKNIEGLNYEIIPDPSNPGDSIVSLDFYNPDANSSGFTEFISSSNYMEIVNPSSFIVHAGVPYGSDVQLFTDRYFSSVQGIFLQVRIPIMNDDEDRVRIGFENNLGIWSASVELTHDTLSTGNMIVYGFDGQVLTYAQSYLPGDILSIYMDGGQVHYIINGRVIYTDIMTSSPNTSFRFRANTVVMNFNTSRMTIDYTFDQFRCYPTGAKGEDNKFRSIITNSTISSTIDYDFSSSSTWYHNSVSGDWTANFINMPIVDDKIIVLSVFVNQSTTAYSPTSISIDGTPVNIKWLGSKSVNGVDEMEFKFIRSGGTWTQVIGKINSYS